ncbi:uncharacterized protein EAF02_011584 [Botrytis sinoallii]|uniref:uncharacterized protein n=1 Tax=Botrytis sinoallii TaxID=1463999 RepID=UPI00190183F6|nr:uncharacterized protein EAF02_011584 [Botrytis sinoallii]KAF7855325.1 hypothetical protein EAF02_011584 [Botrytis sinoallii]
MESLNPKSLLRAALLSTALCAPSITNAQYVITDDTYFYGQSPPVYPSPEMPGNGSWASAYSKAVALVSQMTMAERANLTVGKSEGLNGCNGLTGSVPRLNFKGICMNDAGNGLRDTELVNSWPSGVHMGASWNKNLTYHRGYNMAREFRTKGINVALGPAVGPLGRVPIGGRNWEGMGNDPYLSGKLAAQTVSGIQDAGIIASVKHFIGNEQEYKRKPLGNISAISSNIDDKTIHELYLWPFADTVHAGAACVMCSYNRLNNSYACQNSKALNGLLKTELGFEGFVVSDWEALHAGYAAAEAGLDVVMPSSDLWGVSGENLTASVANGSLAESRLTDMATRIVASWYQMGQDEDFPELGLASSYLTPHAKVNARDPSSKPILLSGAMEGHVLVKNINNALPLKKPELLSIFGYDAPVSSQSNIGNTRYSYGMEAILDLNITYTPINISLQIASNGTLVAGGGSGSNAPPYISAPFDALQEQAYNDDTSLFWDFVSVDPDVNTGSDACLVFLNAYSIENSDRPGLYDEFSDTLVNNVASKCNNTIVTIHNVGIRLVDQWIEHPNVTAVIFGHLPGQDSGRALVKLLYGVESFSGKLPYTIAKNEWDYNVYNHSVPEGIYTQFPQSDFSEGVYLDYRDFDAKNITPRFEFGFGLTYTTFKYSDLSSSLVSNASTAYLPPITTIIQGGAQSLWDVVAKVQATVSNNGTMAAMEVAQLYVGIPNGPVRQLRGFEKVNIPVGESAVVEFELTRRDLSEWSVEEQSWVLQQGSYGIWVGSSSRDLPLSGNLIIGGS